MTKSEVIMLRMIQGASEELKGLGVISHMEGCETRRKDELDGDFDITCDCGAQDARSRVKKALYSLNMDHLQPE